MKRGALGMQLSTTGSIRDTLGVFVARVTPKGPAENAGIIEGDRIVSINGVDLRLSAADAGDSYTRGLPSHRLSREVAKLTPGTVANVRVYSGGRVRDVRVTAGRASDLMNNAFGFRFGGPGSNIGTYQDIPGFRENLIIPRFRMENRPRTRIETIPRMRNEVSPRVRIESFPRTRIGTRIGSNPRIRTETAPRVRMLDLEPAPLVEGVPRLRVLPPLRTPGDRRTWIVLPPEDILIESDGDYLISSDDEGLIDAEDVLDAVDDIVIEGTAKKEVEKGAVKTKTTK